MSKRCQPRRWRRGLNAARRPSQAMLEEWSTSTEGANRWQIQERAPAAHAAQYRLRPLAASLFERVLRWFGVSQSSRFFGYPESAFGTISAFLWNQRSQESILEQCRP